MARRNAESDTPDTTAAEASSGKGRKVVLPNGEFRADYIKRRYYDDGVSRGDIARELTEMTGAKVAYQVVFAVTKPKKEGEAEGAKAES